MARRRYQLYNDSLIRLNDISFDFDNGRCLNVNDEYIMMCSPLSNFHSCWSHNVIFEKLNDPPHIHYLGGIASLDQNVIIMGGEFSDTFSMYKNGNWTYKKTR